MAEDTEAKGRVLTRDDRETSLFRNLAFIRTEIEAARYYGVCQHEQERYGRIDGYAERAQHAAEALLGEEGDGGSKSQA